ncbi:MAG TPA: hypothetical protein VFR04_09515 [Solirubrobacterales bacterium]|nr:hypothetical protein [Solirubrobacterales bacterium]
MAGRESTESKAAQLVGSVVSPTANRLDLAGVFALVAPLAATLGLFKATDSIGRIQRDEPGLLWLAITLVLLAGTMLTIANFLSGEGESAKAKRWARRLFFGASICTALGFVLALGLVFGNAGQESRPQIAATLDDAETKLTAHVTASNMRTDHRLAVKVDLARVRFGETVDSIHPFMKNGSLPLERAYMGPDPDGDVDQEITLSIPPGGKYTNVVIKAYTGATNQSCRELAKGADPGTACTILALDPDHGTPQRWQEVVRLSRSSAPR